MKDKFKDCIPFEPLFFILSKNDNRVVAVQTENEHGYNGLIIDFGFENERRPQWQFEASPYYIAKTYISEMLKKYDFTLHFDIAEIHLTEGNTP